jgi:hypothetical protein
VLSICDVRTQVGLLARVLTGVVGVERVLAASAPDVTPASLPDGSIIPGLTSAQAAEAKEAAKEAGADLARVQVRGIRTQIRFRFLR